MSLFVRKGRRSKLGINDHRLPSGHIGGVGKFLGDSLMSFDLELKYIKYNKYNKDYAMINLNQKYGYKIIELSVAESTVMLLPKDQRFKEQTDNDLRRVAEKYTIYNKNQDGSLFYEIK